MAHTFRCTSAARYCDINAVARQRCDSKPLQTKHLVLIPKTSGVVTALLVTCRLVVPDFCANRSQRRCIQMVRLPFVTLLLLAVATLFSAPQTRADVITDPATLHIGPGGTTGCATGGCPIFGNEVNGIPDGTLDIYQNSGGAPSLLSPILLIFAVPNDTTGTALIATNVGLTATLEDGSGTFLGTEAVTFGVIPLATEFGATGTGLTGG